MSLDPLLTSRICLDKETGSAHNDTFFDSPHTSEISHAKDSRPEKLDLRSLSTGESPRSSFRSSLADKIDGYVSVKENRPVFAAAMMLIAVCFYATSLLLIKMINAWEPGLDSSVLMTVRSAAVCVILTAVTTWRSGPEGWKAHFQDPFELF
jgi:drug/metabolite transporter (DMT)-like permease